MPVKTHAENFTPLELSMLALFAQAKEPADVERALADLKADNRPRYEKIQAISRKIIVLLRDGSKIDVFKNGSADEQASAALLSWAKSLA